MFMIHDDINDDDDDDDDDHFDDANGDDHDDSDNVDMFMTHWTTSLLQYDEDDDANGDDDIGFRIHGTSNSFVCPGSG